MKSCDVDLSDTDVSRITMRFDHDEVQRINTDMFIKLIRGQPYQSKTTTEVDNKLTNKSLEGVETQAWGVLKGRVEELIDTGYTNRFVWLYFFTYALLAIVYVSHVEDRFFNTPRL
jgi:hypothetical protein